MRKTNILALTILASLTLPAFAMPMAQRHCTPDDLQLGLNSSVETQCEWAIKDDVSMQITLHAGKEVPLINATCIFTPAKSDAGKEQDAIVSVQGHKAATIKNLTIKKNTLNFEIYNNGINQNINVLFYLNKTDETYTPGDKIHCSFSDAT